MIPLRMIAPAVAAVVVLVAGVASRESVATVGRTVTQAVERIVRRDMPVPAALRRALAAGTRDSSGRPGRKYWQLWTSYMIRARLDEATATISAHGRIELHNRSDSSMRAIVLRLDQNIFAVGTPRLETVSDTTDGIRLASLRINGEPVELRREADTVRAANGPVGFGVDRTVMRIQLTTPVAAGSTATIDVDWSFRVPRAERGRALRMGRLGDSVHQVAQWYPRVAVFDDLRAGGWDTEPYLGPAEFYNNYGRFDVRIDVPAGWLVAATGTLANPDSVLTPAIRGRIAQITRSQQRSSIVGANERAPGRSTRAGDRLEWRFVADTVSDFAWAASPRFVWDATSARIPGRGSIPIHILYLPESDGYRGIAAIAKRSLEYYSRAVMPYAYPQLTIVDGAEQGMEYPMLVMSDSGRADHEIGHQWWPVMVGNDEARHAFMDEGLDRYMNILFAASSGAGRGLDGLGANGSRGNPGDRPLLREDDADSSSLSIAAYSRPAPMLAMLGEIAGDSAVLRVLGEFAAAWRFKHPTPWDLASFTERALDRDLGWFWYYWLFTTASVDGSISDARIDRGRAQVTIKQDGDMPSPVVLEVRLGRGAPLQRWPPGTRMVDPRTAIVTYPVDVWFAGNRTFTATLDFGSRPIERIVLDPHRRFPDSRADDNVWPRAVRR